MSSSIAGSAPHAGEPRVTAIIIAYKSRPLVLDLMQVVPEDVAVVVVDNSPEDVLRGALMAARPGAAYRHCPENLGFGSAANLGASLARTEFIAILNPDVAMAPDTIARCVAQLEADPGLAAVGEIRGMRISRWLVSDYLTGAFLVMRAAALRAVGGFDDDFFLYFEDTDLSVRLREAGYRIARSDAVPHHRDGHSVVEGETHLEERRWLLGASARLFMRKRGWSRIALWSLWHVVRQGLAEWRHHGSRARLDGFWQSRNDLPGCLRDCALTTGRRRARSIDA